MTATHDEREFTATTMEARLDMLSLSFQTKNYIQFAPTELRHIQTRTFQRDRRKRLCLGCSLDKGTYHNLETHGTLDC
eukprot:m.253889 g.253889  ORF g.253889 m.253889 type:complete len:78 (-) comp19597_c0_seq2:228-461(-)